MRILQLNFERGWRGGERQTLFCMRQFRAAGHEVSLLARRGGDLARQALSEGFTVHQVDNAAGLAWHLIRQGKSYDILHSQTANTITWTVLTQWAHRRPLAFTRRTDFKVKRRESRTRSKWKRVDLFVAISESAAAEPRRFGIEPIIIRSAIEPITVDQARAQAFVREFDLAGKRVLATSGALVRHKDPLTMIRAVHVLAQWRDDFVFVHLGGEGDCSEAARRLVADLNLTERYLFAGFQSDVESLYSVFDVFVMSSVEEALGSSVLDAFLLRVPVVSTSAGGLKESLADGRGLLSSVKDYRALAENMQRMLDNPEFRDTCTQKAYEYVRREHDVQEMGRSYLAAFEDILKKTGSSL